MELLIQANETKKFRLGGLLNTAIIYNPSSLVIKLSFDGGQTWFPLSGGLVFSVEPEDTSVDPHAGKIHTTHLVFLNENASNISIALEYTTKARG